MPQRKEIVQIATIKVDLSTLEVKDEFNVFVKPTYNPILSDYFINLTGITNKKIAQEGYHLMMPIKNLLNLRVNETVYPIHGM